VRMHQVWCKLEEGETPIDGNQLCNDIHISVTGSSFSLCKYSSKPSAPHPLPSHSTLLDSQCNKRTTSAVQSLNWMSQSHYSSMFSTWKQILQLCCSLQ
jgi:hypothetical protein